MVDTVREILASIEASGREGDIAVDAVIDQIVNGKLDEIDAEDIPEPEDEDDVYENDAGYVLAYSRRLERVWIYELADYDDAL